jgi:hypothetical protein
MSALTQEALVGDDDYKGEVTFERLKKLNTYAGVLHLVQGILMLVVSQVVERIREFTLPVTTTFLVYNEEDETLELEDPKEIWSLPIGALTALFLLLSAVAHFIIISPQYWPKYQQDIKRGMNQARWYEYAISSSVMIVLICQLFGCYDLASILLIVGCNASMNFFGLLMEKLNFYTPDAEKDWSPFWFGCFAGAIPWIVCLMYFLGSGDYSQIPGFVYGIFGAYAIFFNTFPINMYLQYSKYGKWADYRYGELGYIILSLFSKSLLAWIVFGGTQQPSGSEE